MVFKLDDDRSGDLRTHMPWVVDLRRTSPCQGSGATIVEEAPRIQVDSLSPTSKEPLDLLARAPDDALGGPPELPAPRWSNEVRSVRGVEIDGRVSPSAAVALGNRRRLASANGGSFRNRTTVRRDHPTTTRARRRQRPTRPRSTLRQLLDHIDNTS
jgi:hypothetical protein